MKKRAGPVNLTSDEAKNSIFFPVYMFENLVAIGTPPIPTTQPPGTTNNAGEARIIGRWMVQL